MSVEATATASSAACGPTSLPPWLININWISLVKQTAPTCVSMRVCVCLVCVCVRGNPASCSCAFELGLELAAAAKNKKIKEKCIHFTPTDGPLMPFPFSPYPLPFSGSRSQWSVCPARNFQAIIVQLYWPTRRERYISRARNPTTLMEGTPNPWPLGTQLSGKQFNSWPRVRQLANRERAPTSVVSS